MGVDSGGRQWANSNQEKGQSRKWETWGEVSRQRKKEKGERRGERKTRWPIIPTLYIHFKHSGSGAIDIVSPRALMSTRDQTMCYERYTLTTQANRVQEA